MQKFLTNITAFAAGLIILSACAEQSAAEENQPTDTSAAGVKQELLPEEKAAGGLHLDAPYKVDMGDLNKDGIKDTILVSAPTLQQNDDMSCVDSSCTTAFSFVNNQLPSFSHEQALGGAIGNAGDLDGDGICEIWFVPDWFTSSWTGLNIYQLKNGVWKNIASASIRRSDGETDQSIYLDYEKRIIRHNAKYFELVENVMEDVDEKLVPKKFYFPK